MYKIELDCYHRLITKRPVKNLADISVDSLYNSLPALCDIPDNEKYKIKILSLDQEILNNGAEQWEYLCAITASSSSDVFDMEKLEVLGDSFLKFSISLILLRKHPTWNEGFLTAVKGRFVSNRNLLYCSIARNLPGILKTIAFNPKNDWQPPLLSIPKSIKDVIVHNCASPNVLWKLKLDNEEIRTGECKTETIRNFIEQFTNEDPDQESAMQIFLGQQRISDKACADCMEALLGVCLRNYGIKRTFSILQFLGITPSNDNLIDLLNINLGSPRLRTNITDTEIDAFLFNYKELEKKLDYTFKDRGYLLQALTHPSFPTNRLTGCYQQLEFIGDAILDFLITSYICEKCDDMGPGKLTDLRSALVNNVTLGCLSVRNKFHVYMLQQNSVLTQSIRKFVQFQETQHYKVTDQVRVLIQETESDVGAMADYIEVPKALGDIFESLIGAVYLDSGNDLETTWKVIYRLMSQEIQQFMRDVPIQVVRRLHEYHGAGPVYSEATVVDDVVMVKCRFTCKNKIVEVTGFGRNKEYAKISAAKIALQTLAQA